MKKLAESEEKKLENQNKNNSDSLQNPDEKNIEHLQKAFDDQAKKCDQKDPRLEELTAEKNEAGAHFKQAKSNDPGVLQGIAEKCQSKAGDLGQNQEDKKILNLGKTFEALEESSKDDSLSPPASTGAGPTSAQLPQLQQESQQRVPQHPAQPKIETTTPKNS